MPIFFVKKMEEAFALQKLLSFFQQKKSSVFGYKVVKHLTFTLSFCDFIQVYVFTTIHHLKYLLTLRTKIGLDTIMTNRFLFCFFPAQS